MTILNKLKDKGTWLEFLNYKLSKNQLKRKEVKELESIIENETYHIVTDDMSFGYPKKMIVSKMDTNKKRIVYSYNNIETWVLKLLTYLLYKYDDKVASNCFSFRRNKTTKSAFKEILKIENLNDKYVLKVDIHDYFNSIDVDILLNTLKDIINNDNELFSFLKELLSQDKCYVDDLLIDEKRGAMAGVPLASFFANIYLLDLDNYFLNNNIPYFRYSDDILVFGNNEEEINKYYEIIIKEIHHKKLTMNLSKYSLTKPQKKWEFLGFSYCDGIIDISNSTIKKMKAKIKRKAHKIYRWRKRKNKTYAQALRLMIRSFDYKFYDLTGDEDFTWTRYYFPVVNSSAGFKEIDQYMEEYLRYLYSGRHYKGNYKIKYEYLKKYGYTPLVSEYYNWKKDNIILDRNYKKTKEELL